MRLIAFRLYGQLLLAGCIPGRRRGEPSDLAEVFRFRDADRVRYIDDVCRGGNLYQDFRPVGAPGSRILQFITTAVPGFITMTWKVARRFYAKGLPRQEI